MSNTYDEVIAAGLSDELCPDCLRPYPNLTTSGNPPTPCGYDVFGEKLPERTAQTGQKELT
jgi:hypothetical protein